MSIRVCVAGATGWTGRLLTKTILHSSEFELTGAIARQAAGQDIGEVLGLPSAGIRIASSLDEALSRPADVVVDFTKPDSVKARTLQALDRGLRVVIGTSGLIAEDFQEIERKAVAHNLGVIAAANFSITAALAKHFALFAARHVPSWEIVDYAHADKPDAPSGTTRELAEELATIAENRLGQPVEETHGAREARGALIAGTPVHSVRLPSYTIAFRPSSDCPMKDSRSGTMPGRARVRMWVELCSAFER